jgi:hypothetical protein
MTTTQRDVKTGGVALFQLKVRTAQGAWINYGRPRDAESCALHRSRSNGFEGTHYYFEAV